MDSLRHTTRVVSVFTGVLVYAVSLAGDGGRVVQGVPAPPQPTAAMAAGAGLPVLFQQNQGQFSSNVRFAAVTTGARLLLGDSDAAVVDVQNGFARAIRWRFRGAGVPTIAGEDMSRARFNYIGGRDAARWQTAVPAYARVRYRGLYPGVDAVYYAAPAGVEFDIVVQPGAAVSIIDLEFAAGTRLAIDTDGRLTASTSAASTVFDAPVIYQHDAGRRRRVDGRYELRGARRVGFTVGAYDNTRPLVIDPVITTASLFGGTFGDAAAAVAVGDDGTIYIAGETGSPDLPLSDALDGVAADTEGFIAGFTPDGAELVFATFFGGAATDRIGGLAIDGSGHIYVAGRTASADFPLVNPMQSTFVPGNCPIVGPIFGIPPPPAPCTHAFAAKLSPNAAAILYSTYLGGSHAEEAFAIAVDAAGAAYVAGETFSADFPVSPGAADATYTESGCGNEFQSRRCEEGFVVKLSPAGNTAAYSTLLGGRRLDEINDIAIDDAGRAYVTGTTGSEDYPLVNAFQSVRQTHQCAQNFSQCFEAFVARINASGTSFEYSTYLSGGGRDWGLSIAVGPDGSAFVSGTTESHSFPVANAWQPALKPLPPSSGTCLSGMVNPPACPDAFLTRLTPDGSALMFSTFLGGTSIDDANAVALDAFGNLYVTGTTGSFDFPTVHAYQRGHGGGTNDAFVAMFTADGAILGYSSFIGGAGNDSGRAIAIDAAGQAFVAGLARAGFPTSKGAFQTAEGGEFDAFLAKVAPAWASGVTVRDAGNDVSGPTAGDVYGTRTSLGMPFQIAADGFGNRFIADATNNRIYKVGPNNRIVPVAGNGTAGFSGDLGPPLEASLNAPAGIAVDTAGNLYIADSGNHRVRMIDVAQNVIFTIAGTGAPGFGGDFGQSPDAMLAFPLGVAVSGDRIYIADTYNHRIRQITSDGVITTVAGNGTAANGGDGQPATAAPLHTPTALAVAGGRLVIASWGGHTVRAVTGGVISTLAGTGTPGFSGDGGPANAAELNGPFGVAASGNRVYIADEINHRVRVVYPDGTIATAVGSGTPGAQLGNGHAADVKLAFPVGVGTDQDDNLFVSDAGNARVLRVFRISGLN